MKPLAGRCSGGLAHLTPAALVLEHVTQTARDLVDVERIDEISRLSVSHHVGHAAAVRRHDRHAGRHGFLDPERCVLLERYETEDAGGCELAPDPSRIDGAQTAHAVSEAQR